MTIWALQHSGGWRCFFCGKVRNTLRSIQRHLKDVNYHGYRR